MKIPLLAPALAALAMFVFGAAFWMSPFPYKVLKRVADDAAAGESLAKIFPVTGSYIVPGPHLDPKQVEALMHRGPFVEVHFVREGLRMMEPFVLLKGYLHEFVLCLLITLMLVRLAPAFGSWTARLRFCAMLGLIVALGHYARVIWWHHSIAWETMMALYDFLSLVIVGLVLGKMLTPKKSPKNPAMP
jgi:hypothetical protein